MRKLLIAAILGCSVIAPRLAQAGMPALLPTNWTADHTPEWAPSRAGGPYDARLQAISFFVAGVLFSAWGLQWLWGSLRKDWAWLPELTYRRSLSLVVLWGLLFVIVLTMISGARELMTPGAWRKQGWTYRLADAPPTFDPQAERRAVLERLRVELLRYAATHEGRFPDSSDDVAGVDPAAWNLPNETGVRFLLIPGRKAGDQRQVVVYEPRVDFDERLVMLSDGMIGTLSSAQIAAELAATKAPGEPQ